MSPGRPIERIGSGRLAARIYLAGLVAVVVIATAFQLFRRYAVEPAWRNARAQVAEFAVLGVAERLGQPDALAAEVKRVGDVLGAGLTLYDAAGRVVASNVHPPLPPLTPGQRASLAMQSIIALDNVSRVGVAVPGTAAPVYAVFELQRPGDTVERAVFGVGVVLVCLAFASLLLARWLARPLAHLASAARAFGAGDLTVRTGLDRRDELGDMARAFDEMAARIAQLLRAQQELLANVSHELRTPLSRIRVALELAGEGDAQLARASLLDIAEDLAELERLMDDVLATARFDLADGRVSATPPLRVQPVDAALLVGHAATRFRGAHPARRLHVEVEADLPPLLADPALLRRAVDNLLDNAGKYSDPAGAVRLRASAVGGRLAIEIADEGAGIAPEDLPHLATPFFRGDRSRARKTGGFGLGLALAQRIVQAHGGQIDVESHPGAGTTARIVVPMAPA